MWILKRWYKLLEFFFAIGQVGVAHLGQGGSTEKGEIWSQLTDKPEEKLFLQLEWTDVSGNNPVNL